MDFEFYMREALNEARLCFETGDVPVSAIICDENGNIIARSRNKREKSSDATAHAEIEAIREACRAKNSWRLDGCTIFITLEPCPMCAGAIINSRISRVVYGAKEEKSGCCGSVLNLFEERFNHKPAIYGGILAEDSANMLKEFFRGKR